jgi:polysaccharide biosynthesis transport protein
MTDDNNKNSRVVPSEEVTLLRSNTQLAPNSFDNYPAGYAAYNPPAESINLREIWRKIRKHRVLILTVAFIITTLVTIEAFRAKSLYQAAAKIAIGRDASPVVKTGDIVIATDDADEIKTEMLLIRTYPLLEDVVIRLQLSQNPKFLDVSEKKTVWESLKTILSKFAFGNKPEPLPTPVDVTPELIESDGVQSYEESQRLAPYVAVLNSGLNIEQIPETRALSISFTHTDPAVAAAVTNGLAESFVERSFKTKTERFRTSHSWLEKSTRELQTRVQQAEQALANYSRQNNIFTTDDKDNLVVDKLATLYGQVLKSETDRVLKQSLYQEVRNGRVAQLPEAFADAKLIGLQTRLGELRISLAQISARYGPDNPKSIEVQQQIAELENLISSGTVSLEGKLKADYERAVRDEQLLKQSLERAKSEANQQNQAAIQFNILKQNVETAKGLYNDFLQKTSQANVQVAEQHNNLRIIEPARLPGGPIGPKRLRSILIGLFLSLVLGVGLAFGLEYLDNTVKNVEDVTRITQLPTLAVIPAIGGATMRLLNGQKKAAQQTIPADSAQQPKAGSLAPRPGYPAAGRQALASIVESYRMLRTSVLLSTAGSAPKVILVTSGQPSEGKTTTAVNTAISMAQLGASVLLIDADMRRPAVHKAFKVSQPHGLSTYLSGRGSLKELIQPLPIKNLSLLPCGPIPPNPAELISSERMKTMILKLTAHYDHVIIDSPPVMNVTDPVILSTMVDGVILVVRAGKSTRDVLRRARQELSSVGAKIFGVVLNNVDFKREGYDDYYYQRYYSSYGQEKKEAVG